MARRFLRIIGIGRRRHESDEEFESDMDDDDDNDGSRNPVDPASQMPKITFDKHLPSSHEYLGEDLEEMQGRTILDDDGYINLPLLSLVGVVLMPGQILPLHLFQPRDVAMIRQILNKNKTFGQVAARYTEDNTYHLSPVGTTAELLAVKEDDDEPSGISATKIKAIGRQRFKVIETHRQIDGILMAKVRILPEKVLPDQLNGACPPSYLRIYNSVIVSRISDDTAAGESINPINSTVSLLTTSGSQTHLRRRRQKMDHLYASHFTHWPSWVYRQYDPSYLMRKINAELNSWNESFDLENTPKEASEFSFWVAGVLPLDDATKLELLQTDCSIQRLMSELKLMKRCTDLCCKHCQQLIANKNEVFSMSVDGPLGAYVNPQGHVHETLTVYKAQGLELRGRPSTESSWFPGYAWTIAVCKQCQSHMGWRFTLSNRNSHLKPEKFWGLCRATLSTRLVEEHSDAELPLLSPVESHSDVLSLI